MNPNFMLPVINIDLNVIFPQNKTPVGTTFLFDWAKVLEACRMSNLSFDRYLTIRIGSYIQRKKYKIPILILFESQLQTFKLIICSKSVVDFTHCLHSISGMAGYIEFGDESLNSKARGFLYYSGSDLTRIYHVLELPAVLEGLYASDFGNGFGLHVSQIEEGFYNALVREPTEYPEYSFVPNDEKEIIVTPQNRVELSHAFSSF